MEEHSKTSPKKPFTFFFVVIVLLVAPVLIIAFLLFRTELESGTDEKKEDKKTILKAIQKGEHPIYIPKDYSVNFVLRDGYWKAYALTSDEDLINLAANKNIEKLMVKNSEITEKGFKALAGEPITELILNRPLITKNAIKTISKLKSLRLLEIKGNPSIDDELLQALDGPRALTSLSIRDTSASNQTLKRLPGLFPKLKSLDLRKCKTINSKGLRALTKLKNLEILILSNIPLSEDSIKAIRRIPSLTNLSLTDTKIDDKQVALLKLRNLKRLDLSENPITGDFFKSIAMPRLELLKLDSCRYMAPQKLAQFQKKKPQVKIYWSQTHEKKFDRL